MKKIIIIGIVTLGILTLLANHLIFGTVKISSVRDGVFQVYSQSVLGRIGSNITLFETDQGLVAVDAHLAPLIGRAMKKIEHRSKDKIIAVFNTHWHPDHSGGNGVLTAGADIIAHENTKALLSKPHKGFGLTKPGSVHEFAPVEAANLPEILVGEAMDFTKYGARFEAKYVANAHTNGDLVIHAPSYGVTALGDLVWPNSFPYVDVYNGGSASGILAALRQVLQTSPEDQLFVIGHGAPMTMQELGVYVDMLRQTIELVTIAKANGDSLQTIQNNNVLANWSAWQSKLVPTNDWIRMIFETL